MELKQLYIKKIQLGFSSKNWSAQLRLDLARELFSSGNFSWNSSQLPTQKMWRRLWMFPYWKTLLIGDLSSDSTAPTWKCCHSKNRKRYINKIETILLFLLVWKAGLVRHWLKNWLLIFDSLSYLIMEKHFYFLLQFIYHTT